MCHLDWKAVCYFGYCDEKRVYQLRLDDPETGFTSMGVWHLWVLGDYPSLLGVFAEVGVGKAMALHHAQAEIKRIPTWRLAEWRANADEWEYVVRMESPAGKFYDSWKVKVFAKGRFKLGSFSQVARAKLAAQKDAANLYEG